jgi:NAD(P)-dependent dehydrogenase (short-subunit alcohol dehydrogenase family)
LGATYSIFDVEHILRDNPKLTAQLLDGALDFVARGIVKPANPRQVFPVSRVKEAVRLMQTGQHSGKLLLSWEDDDVVSVVGDGGASARLRPDATYVLVGGLGGIGRSLARMLVDIGAQHLCFLSRSGWRSEAAKALIADLSAQKVDARGYACDVADKEQLQAVLRQVACEQPPIRGVLQCAMALHDATFANMTYDQWQSSLRAKVQSSWNIHHLVPNSADLDFFVLLSSFAGLFGNIGQSNYGAGSSYQDAIAHYRRRHGMRAVALDLGIIKDVGVLAESGLTDNLKQWAAFGIGEPQLHGLVRAAIQDQASGLCHMPPQVPTGIPSRGAALAAGVEPPAYLKDPRFGFLSCDGSGEQNNAAQAGPSFLVRLNAAKSAGSASQAEGVMTEMLVHKIAKCLGVAEDRIDVARSLPSYGINSLVAIEIRNWLFKEAMVDVTVFNLISPLPIKGLVGKVVKGLGV